MQTSWQHFGFGRNSASTQPSLAVTDLFVTLAKCSQLTSLMLHKCSFDFTALWLHLPATIEVGVFNARSFVFSVPDRPTPEHRLKSFPSLKAVRFINNNEFAAAQAEKYRADLLKTAPVAPRLQDENKCIVSEALCQS